MASLTAALHAYTNCSWLSAYWVEPGMKKTCTRPDITECLTAQCNIEGLVVPYTPALKPGCLMSHKWLHTPDCKVCNEVENANAGASLLLRTHHHLGFGAS